MKRRVFQWFTAILLIVCVWTAYSNVMSDDSDVRAKALATVKGAAGCGDDCKIENLRGERGMITEEIHYELIKYGHYAIACRRAYVVAGDYACTVIEGKVTTDNAAATSPSSTSSTSSTGSTGSTSSTTPKH